MSKHQKETENNILQERLGEDNTSTAEISESQEKVFPPIDEDNDDLLDEQSLQRPSEILDKVKEKTKKFAEDSKFFQMQDELLKKVERRNQSPRKELNL